ncbi:MAG TPA: hypothetical protein EYO59_12380 [Chromatiaceae bacterium]|nr:hypothetical protein [Chromatiaceae bacterium]
MKLDYPGRMKMQVKSGDLVTLFGIRRSTKAEYEIGKWLIVEKREDEYGSIYYDSVMMNCDPAWCCTEDIPGYNTTLTERYMKEHCLRVEVQTGQKGEEEKCL